MKLANLVLFSVGLLLCCGLESRGRADEELSNQATWDMTSPAQVLGEVQRWMEDQGADAEKRQRLAAIFQAEDGDLLDQIAESISLVEPRAKRLVEVCRAGAKPDATAAPWLAEEKTKPIVRNNLKLLLARSLTQESYFDEALVQLDTLDTTDVLDPASLLFYTAVAHHRLVHKEKGLAAIDRLLENKDVIPRRYAVLARLMRVDMNQLKDGSLDDVSRRMKDIERRLGLGRAGQRVRDVEDEVIEMLDKLIKEEEAKCKACQAAGGGGGQSAKPAQDSMPLGGKGPGEVVRKRIGKSPGWGELPPKDRQEAMQEIGRDFPAHYRKAIEQYYRELAKQK